MHKRMSKLDLLQFVRDLTLVSKKHGNKPLQNFILLSPAPVDVASKLSYILYHLSMKVRFDFLNMFGMLLLRAFACSQCICIF